jgi:hypothetical protein
MGETLFNIFQHVVAVSDNPPVWQKRTQIYGSKRTPSRRWQPPGRDQSGGPQSPAAMEKRDALEYRKFLALELGTSVRACCA